MGQEKPGILLAGRPALRWMLDVFEPTRAVAGVVVAVLTEDVATWRRRSVSKFLSRPAYLQVLEANADVTG